MIDITELEDAPAHYDWHLIVPHLTNGLAYNPFMTLRDVLQRHAQHDVSIGVIYEDDTVVGGVAWEVLTSPSDDTRRFMNILALGCLVGAYEEHRHDILTGLETIAQVCQCQTLFATGRRGWERMARDAGYTVMDHVLFYKEFK